MNTKSGPSSPTHRLERVLFAVALNPSQKFGTMEEQVFRLALGFRDRGGLFLPVFIAPLDPGSAALYQAEGLRAEAMDLRRFRTDTLKWLIRVIRRERIETVVWNFYDSIKNPYVHLSNMLMIRVNHDLIDHNSRYSSGASAPDDPRWWLKWPLARGYRRVLGVSDFVRDHLTRLHWPRPGRFHHFVNTDRFRPDLEARHRFRVEHELSDRFLIVAIANLIPPKGVDVAIRALARLPARAVLGIVGSGPEEANLIELARALDVQDRVRFWGLQRHVEPYLQAADCMVCPSLWNEAAGLVNIEALACGLPVLASRTGGIPEFVADGRTGHLFPAGDFAALSGHVLELMLNDQARTIMGQEARRDAVERFSVEPCVDEFLKLYVRPGAIAAPDLARDVRSGRCED